MAPARIEDDTFDITIKEYPITEQRVPFIQQEGNKSLKQPETPRANIAVSVEAPNGTHQADWARRHRHQTVLQQHIDFFDPDRDGVIWPLDTYNGFRRLGYSISFSIFSMFIIHINFSYPTLVGFLPDPCFRIYAKRIHKTKHGSDSGTYDTEGRYIPQKFEDIFAKYASGDKQGIYFWEIWDYMKGQRMVADIFGWGGTTFEWMATYILLWPEDGRIMKDDIRRIFDGSLFYEVEAKRDREGKNDKLWFVKKKQG